jgi:hypothetical protein
MNFWVDNNMSNKTKTIQTILFASLIAAMILPFSSMQGTAFAQKDTTGYEADEVDNALIDMEPYVTINEKKFAKIHVNEAKKNGVSQESINITKDYVKMINNLAKEKQDNPKNKLKLSDSDKAKFSEFFAKVKNVGSNKSKIVQTNSYLDYLLPFAYAIPCNTFGPHPQPATTFDGPYSTRAVAIASLSSGFNPVPNYASVNDGDDYADFVSAYFCDNGVFRIQSIVGENPNGTWYFSEHHGSGEPNPEIFGYDWPVFWWGPYAYAWHSF